MLFRAGLAREPDVRPMSVGSSDPRENHDAERTNERRIAGEVLDLKLQSTHRIITGGSSSSTLRTVLPGGCPQSLRFVTLPP